MTILITGGAGYLGTVLLELILANIPEANVIVYDNLMYKQDGIFALLANKRVRFVYGDVRDYNHLDKYLQQADYVIPLAAIVGMPACDKDPRLAEDVNWRQLQHIAEDAPYRCRIIVPNTNSGYGQTNDGQPCTEKSILSPISVYGQTKCAGERAVMEAGGEFVSLRLATVFGTSYRFRKDLLVNDFVLKALTDKYIVLFESHFKRNFIHIRDVCMAMCMAICQWDKFKGQVFNVGLSSANLSKLELCHAIQKFIPFVIKQDDFTSDADKRNYVVSNDKLEATGWVPLHSLDDGIQELIKAYSVFINSNTKYTNL